MIEKFSKGVAEQLGYYVYRLVDPRNGETFYVGKGQGDRIFAHVNDALKQDSETSEKYDDDSMSLKFEKIREITYEGLEVIHIIHRHGLDNDEIAYEVESAVMDCYPNLTNKAPGHNSKCGVKAAATLNRDLSTEEYKEPEDIAVG